MNKFMRLALLLLIAIPLISVAGTWSYFTDDEISDENCFTTGVWYKQADCLIVDTLHTQLTGIGDQSKLHGTLIKNNCTEDIVIDKLWVSWNNDSVNMVQIVVRGHTYYSNGTSSALIEDINCTLEQKFKHEHITFIFEDQVFLNDGITFNYIMADGSNKYVLWPDSQTIW